jgi:hypothetical protein
MELKDPPPFEFAVPIGAGACPVVQAAVSITGIANSAAAIVVEKGRMSPPSFPGVGKRAAP